MATWGKPETFKLIDLWAEDRTQEELEGCHRNRDVFVRIATKLREVGYDRTFEQCREKIKKLKKDYRKIKDKHEETGQGRERWAFFEAMDAVLGHKPSTCPSFVVDTSADIEGRREEDNDTLFTQPLVETESTDTSEQPVSTPSSNAEDRPPSPSKKNKKKKRTKADQFEVVMDGVVQQLVEAQDRAEERYMELEEKRMRIEERLMEKEIELQRQSQQFQLQMMQMMSNLVNSQRSPQSFPPPISTSTQYPRYYSSAPYDDDLTQV